MALAWDVSYTATGVILTVVEATEEVLSQGLNATFNDGIIQTRARLDDWANAGEIGLPGSNQRLGDFFSADLQANGSTLLPTISASVTTVAELEAALVAAGYQVDAIAGDGSGELLKVSIADRSTEFDKTIAAAANAFDDLSNIPDGVQLSGDLTYDATVHLTDFRIGISGGGFYLDPSSIFELTVEGGGTVSQQDYPLTAGGAPARPVGHRRRADRQTGCRYADAHRPVADQPIRR